MRKILPFILIGMMLMQAGGYFFLFRFRLERLRAEVKQSIKSRIPDSDLVTFEFSADDLRNLHWENEKEFRFKGNWYDVVRKEILRDGKVLFHCFDDQRESRFHDEVQSEMEQLLNGKDSRSMLKNYRFLSLIFIVPESPQTIQRNIPLSYFDCTSGQLSEGFLLKSEPPPDPIPVPVFS